MFAASLFAQNSVQPIQWENQVSAATANAKATLRPLLVYVPGDSESRSSDLDRQQQRALRDPTVIAIVNARFVPLRLPQTSQSRPVLDVLGLPTQYGMYLAALPPGALENPEGHTKIALIDPMTMASSASLIRSLTTAYRTYGASIYEAQIKPLFESESPTDANINKALTVIGEFIVEQADDDVIKLLETHGDNKRMRKSILETLARISTTKSTNHLFEMAVAGDREAQMALGTITPDMAEQVLLPKLRSEKEEERYPAYKALTDVFNIKPVRNEKWWERIREIQRDKELQMITDKVKADADQWRQTYGRIR
ncbi:MAG: hypothetical protein AB7N71_09635 [Phycisphaerae bacterium]